MRTKIKKLDDLKNLGKGDEVLIMRLNKRYDGSSDTYCFTCHGKIHEINDEQFTIENQLRLPVTFATSTLYSELELLSFLRGFQDPRFPREQKPITYTISKIDLSDTVTSWEIYKIY